jgi:hypothetical protein
MTSTDFLSLDKSIGLDAVRRVGSQSPICAEAAS